MNNFFSATHSDHLPENLLTRVDTLGVPKVVQSLRFLPLAKFIKAHMFDGTAYLMSFPKAPRSREDWAIIEDFITQKKLMELQNVSK